MVACHERRDPIREDRDVDDHTDREATDPSAPGVATGIATGVVVADVPPPELRYKRKVSIGRAIRDAWGAREITRSLAERQIRSRYKQAVLGFAWSVLTPLVLMFAFSVLFTRVADIDTQGVPYALFAYVGLVVWTFFSNSVNNAQASIVGNITLINKVPCPREVFPLSAVVQASFDASLSLIALVGLFVIKTFMPRPTSYWVPVLLLVLFAFVIGIAIMVSVLVVYIRDLRTALPLALQFGLFATPVAFGFEVIPEAWRGLYSVINPLGPVIDGLRRSVLFGEAPQLEYLGLAAIGAVLYLAGGYWLFKRMEAGIADIA
jgi:ABC-2 type transport system permease protein/lipopolysaccharide transport system permease protein